MDAKSITSQLFRRWHLGHEPAMNQAFQALQTKFRYVALQILRDEQYAQEAINNAFLKLNAKVLKGTVRWQGEGPLCAFFKTSVRREAVTIYRELYKRNRFETQHPMLTKWDDESNLEYIERLADRCVEDVWEQIVQEHRNKVIQEDFMKFSQEHFSERGRRFYAAYQQLMEIPGAAGWPTQKKTAFIKQQLKDLGLSDNAFHAAHTRFRQKLEPFLRDWRLWNG